MPKFLVMVKHDSGTADRPMDEWDPADVAAHMTYYETMQRELLKEGEQVRFMALADPKQAKIVRSNGVSAPVVHDGPFAEYKEVLAGFQVLVVESEARALEIAAHVSAVPGPGGVPLEQLVEVREVVVDE
jgi:hypothetical protein